jgi:hypothetical protein
MVLKVWGKQMIDSIDVMLVLEYPSELSHYLLVVFRGIHISFPLLESINQYRYHREMNFLCRFHTVISGSAGMRPRLVLQPGLDWLSPISLSKEHNPGATLPLQKVNSVPLAPSTHCHLTRLPGTSAMTFMWLACGRST